jgi:hypothetical protein
MNEALVQQEMEKAVGRFEIKDKRRKRKWKEGVKCAHEGAKGNKNGRRQYMSVARAMQPIYGLPHAGAKLRTHGGLVQTT